VSQPDEQQRELGGLVITPGQGADVSVVQMHTSGGCPKEADAYYAFIKGKGFPADGQIVIANTDVGLSHTGGFDVYLAQTLKDFASDNNSTLQGQYEMKVRCIDAFSQSSFGEYTAKLEFGSPTAYAALGPAKGPDRVPDKPAAAAEEIPLPAPPTPAPPAAASTAQTAEPAAAIQAAPQDSNLVPFLVLAGFVVALAAVLVTSIVLRKRAKREGEKDA
jgi:hypothetical protein